MHCVILKAKNIIKEKKKKKFMIFLSLFFGIGMDKVGYLNSNRVGENIIHPRWLKGVITSRKYRVPHLVFEYEKRGISVLQVPLVDGGVPTPEEMMEILENLENLIEQSGTRQVLLPKKRNFFTKWVLMLQ